MTKGSLIVEVSKMLMKRIDEFPFKNYGGYCGGEKFELEENKFYQGFIFGFCCNNLYAENKNLDEIRNDSFSIIESTLGSRCVINLKDSLESLMNERQFINETHKVEEVATREMSFMHENTIKTILANENNSLAIGYSGSLKERIVFLDVIASFYRDNSDFLAGFEEGTEVKP
tara:strand:+ start:429 stop:947 length:519 start_codon:yes stop_codon:yes gene_type:complete